MEFLTKSPTETEKIAKLLAGEIMRKKPALSGALVLALAGELGTGKTVFARAFLKALGVRQKITSPTFLIIKSYKLKTKNYKLAYHIDVYRLTKPKELLDLGFSEIINDPLNIAVIEWADRIKGILPRGSLRIDFKHGKNERTRMIEFRKKK